MDHDEVASVWRALIRIALPGLLLATAACSQSPSSPDSATSQSPTPAPSASDTAAPDATPEAPSHNYADKIGDIYYYSAAVSQNAQENGQAASDALGFRYLGQNQNGEFVIMKVDSRGIPEGSAACANPCHVIRTSDGQSMMFNPSSVIGAVFEDAMNGQLEGPAPPPTPVAAPSPDPATLAANDAAQAASDAEAAANTPNLPPAMPGQCFQTAVHNLTTAVEGPDGSPPQPGRGLAITFADGHRLVDYSGHAEALPWRIGDPVRLCVQSLPIGCSPGERGGVTYSARNLRDEGTWTARDSVHNCSGG